MVMPLCLIQGWCFNGCHFWTTFEFMCLLEDEETFYPDWIKLDLAHFHPDVLAEIQDFRNKFPRYSRPRSITFEEFIGVSRRARGMQGTTEGNLRREDDGSTRPSHEADRGGGDGSVVIIDDRAQAGQSSASAEAQDLSTIGVWRAHVAREKKLEEEARDRWRELGEVLDELGPRPSRDSSPHNTPCYTMLEEEWDRLPPNPLNPRNRRITHKARPPVPHSHTRPKSKSPPVPRPAPSQPAPPLPKPAPVPRPPCREFLQTARVWPPPGGSNFGNSSRASSSWGP